MKENYLITRTTPKYERRCDDEYYRDIADSENEEEDEQ